MRPSQQLPDLVCSKIPFKNKAVGWDISQT
jgi:hypothetical protein